FNVNLSAGEAIFLTMIPIIATAFPITPSGAGAVELTLFSCLRLIGVASPLAVSLTIVNRFIDYWMHIALGAFTWMIRGKIGLRTWKDRADQDGDGQQKTLTTAAEKEIIP
ncbi:MAG TPA: flippase-like domain-containing protein, partial [Nitrospirota bacterium]